MSEDQEKYKTGKLVRKEFKFNPCFEYEKFLLEQISVVENDFNLLTIQNSIEGFELSSKLKTLKMVYSKYKEIFQ